MGLFEKIFGSKKSRELIPTEAFRTLTAYAPVFSSWSGGLYESELVRDAIDAKARHISKLTVKVVGSAKPALQTILKHQPNEWQTWSQFLYRLSTILDTNNTAFIVPVLDRTDDMVGIATVLASQCSVVQYQGIPFLRCTFSTGQTAAIELQRVGIMTRFQYRDDLIGESNAAMGQTMELINLQNQGIEAGIKNAAAYRFMATLTNFSSPEDLAEERKQFSANNLRAEDGGVLLFPNTYANAQQITTKPFVVDADQMRLIQDNVFNHVGVSIGIIQSTAKAEELNAFYNGSIEPFMIQLSQVLAKMIFSPLERSYNNDVVVSANRLQYMSVGDKVSLARELADRGCLMIDEIRELFDYPALPDGAGQMVPIRGEYYDASKESEE